MASRITYRGPDDDGYFTDGPIGLGMRRLSIIDLAGGAQPIENETGTCQIVFNGEIYNYRDLRMKLTNAGHRFSSNTDTETILHLYEDEGAECVHRLNGMFAFAIWDSSRKSLLLARDRLGIKPLYYWWDGRALVFGSEIKAILASEHVGRRINRQAISDYLTFRYVPAPETMWQNIYKLPPGHILELSLREEPVQPEVRRYWDIHYSEKPEPASFDEDLASFSSLFEDAVGRRLVADVPVGILLSGGLDSSAVAAAVSELHDSSLSTFSVAFDDPRAVDETGFARQVAHALGTDHHEVVIDYDDFAGWLPEFVWHTDEPLADPASIPLFYVSRLAADHVKVVLSGEGADEILGGYDFDQVVARWQRFARFHRLPRWIRESGPRAVLGAVGQTDLADRVARANVPVEARNLRFLRYMTSVFDEAEKLALWADAPIVAKSERTVRKYYCNSGVADPLHQRLYAYCQDWLVEDLLMKADRMTMANSLELRVPFLDHRMVEWLASRPSDIKVGRRVRGQLTTKRILRAYAASRLPQSILRRPKEGFPVPLKPWMEGGLGDLARDLLLDSNSRTANWFDRQHVELVLRKSENGGGAGAVQKAWVLLVLELWSRRWLE